MVGFMSGAMYVHNSTEFVIVEKRVKHIKTGKKKECSIPGL